MITIYLPKSNQFPQEDHQAAYNELIDQIPFHQLRCTCGRCGDLIRHGSYTRKIKFSLGFQRIKIYRVICKSCGRTHVLTPDWLVPYSSILLKDQVRILQAHLAGESMEPIMAEQPVIDESAIGYIIRQFKRHWLPRLTAFQIPLVKISSQPAFAPLVDSLCRLNVRPICCFAEPTQLAFTSRLIAITLAMISKIIIGRYHNER